MSDTLPYLATEQLSIGYRSKGEKKVISSGLNLALRPGNLVCLLGSNGSGKSTLMRTLAGLQPALEGNIKISQKLLSELPPEVLAKKLSLVLTERVEVGNLTAREIITLGRTPYTGWLGILSNQDREKVNQAITLADVGDLLEKRANQLSDGERQKVMVARALAQDTDLILLDEPTAHLDLPNRIEMINLLHDLARNTGKAILLSTHELDLALQTADYLWLLKHNGEIATGVPEDLVLNGSFESAFSKAGFSFDKMSGTFTINKKSGKFAVSLDGVEPLVSWTKRAFKREGYTLASEEGSQLKISAIEENGRFLWRIDGFEKIQTVETVESLLHAVRVTFSK